MSKFLVVSLLLFLTVTISLVSSQSPQLKLNTSILPSSNDNLLSLTLVCHYHSPEQTAEEVRRHREASILSFLLNGSTVRPDSASDYGLTEYREWDFESGAMAQFAMSTKYLFIGTFSCKSITETSSVVQLIFYPSEKTSPEAMAALYAIAGTTFLLFVCLIVIVSLLYCKLYSPKTKSATFLSQSQNRNSFILSRSSLTSTNLETGQHEHIPVLPHSKERFCQANYVNSSEEVTLDCRGGRYRNEDHDIELHVPQFAVPDGQQITVKIAVSLSYPLQLQSGLRPVSPTVELCVVDNTHFKFTKPVKIILPHFLTVTSQNDLQFVKADHGEKEFKRSDGKAFFEAGSSYGTLLTNHFCHFCIASGIESTSKVNFRLIRITPKNPSVTWRAQYCVTYFLQTCLTSLESSYDAKNYEVTSLKRFVLSNTETALQIHFERRLAGGWLLAQDGGSSKVTESEVDFWQLDISELKQMEEEELYPPRFFIKVNGRQATDQATAVIRFTGAQGDLETELSLEPLTQQTDYLQTSISLPNVSRFNFVRPPLQRYRLSDPTLPSHSLLMNYIAAEIPAKWRAVGTQLNLSIGRLDQIEYDHHRADRCFSEVFSLWERQSEGATPYEWSSLFEALRSPQVSENKLANDIELMVSATTSNTSLSVNQGIETSKWMDSKEN